VPPVPAPSPTAPAARRPKLALIATGVLVVLGLGIFLINRGGLSQHGTEPKPEAQPAAEGAASPAFKPPPHSIAVLPFENLSADKEQEYFSDGLTEELLNSLAEIDGLQVVARTSAFSFKGTNTDIGTIAHKLNVGTVLEGSVRRSAHTIRITTQLINAVTGFQLWSKTYDRDTGDILKLQTEIATAVAGAMKVTLLGDLASKIELGGTANPAAFDAYLRGVRADASRTDSIELPSAISAYTEAILLDPHFALAFAYRSMVFRNAAIVSTSATATRENLDKSRADAEKALNLTPGLAQAHLALAKYFEATLNFTQASDEYERATLLGAGNAQILRSTGFFAVEMGRLEAGLAAIRQAVVLDPLDLDSHIALVRSLYFAHRYEEALAANAEVIRIYPGFKTIYGTRGQIFYALGEFEHARASCETKNDSVPIQVCLALVYDKLGRRTDAKAVLAKLKAAMSDACAYQYAQVYAQWGDRTQALEWLEIALRLKDGGLAELRIDPLLDPLRQELRFQAVERQLRFPS
jgi:TolB-like protein/tetratricopeptide (TPR) repeat protein